VSAIALTSAAGYGTFLLYTALALGWRGLGVGPTARTPHRKRRLRLPPPDLLASLGVLFVVGTALGFTLFGGAVPAIVAGSFAATAPLAARRRRTEVRRATAQEAWPRLIEEVRILTGSLGRSIPQALFEAGRRAPAELRPAFEDAHREWLISTDFARTVAVLKAALRDPTADATCETLLVAHELGGTDVDRRLEALVDDRIQDVQGRKDARARQAGVRFARRFVLIVPLGMALAGLSLGNGRAAYGSAAGQLAVTAGILLVALCWIWAGRVMRLPVEQRVFDR
jgi:tight adherence protein B